MNTPAPSDTELHAYVDGELPETRHAEITLWLTQHPEDAARVETVRTHKTQLRLLFDPVAAEPVPAHLRAWAMAPTSAKVRWFKSPWLMRLAASWAIAIAAASAGWWSHAYYAPMLAVENSLAHRAAIAHVVFSPDVKRPVEIGADHEEQLVLWLSKRLGTTVRPPKLGNLGFELIGGRLLPGHSGPVAQFMYHDASGQRLTLYVSTDNTQQRDTAFRFEQEGPVNVFYWIDGPFGYAISAGIAKPALAQIALAVYEQLQGKTTPSSFHPPKDPSL